MERVMGVNGSRDYTPRRIGPGQARRRGCLSVLVFVMLVVLVVVL